MNSVPFAAYVLVMAGVTYLIRMLPFLLVKPIKSPFIRSFLHYVPFAVLGAMTLPDILYATASLSSALCGLAVAVVLALRGKGLLTVALAACAAVFLVERLV